MRFLICTSFIMMFLMACNDAENKNSRSIFSSTGKSANSKTQSDSPERPLDLQTYDIFSPNSRALFHYYNASTVDHFYTIGQINKAGYVATGTEGGLVGYPSFSEPLNANPFFECLMSGTRHFIGTLDECKQGQSPKFVGYFSRVAFNNSKTVYRCSTTSGPQTWFLTSTANCDGLGSMNYLMGYIANVPLDERVYAPLVHWYNRAIIDNWITIKRVASTDYLPTEILGFPIGKTDPQAGSEFLDCFNTSKHFVGVASECSGAFNLGSLGSFKTFVGTEEKANRAWRCHEPSPFNNLYISLTQDCRGTGHTPDYFMGYLPSEPAANARAHIRQDSLTFRTIDFSQTLGPALQRGSGFLLPAPYSDPNDVFLKQLSPKMIRIIPFMDGIENVFSKIQNAGASTQVIVGQEFAKDNGLFVNQNGPWPGDGGSYTNWETKVQQIMDFLKARAITPIFDMWNEPDIKLYWNRSYEQFLATWNKGFKKIRANDPNAIIVGPSVGLFDAPSASGRSDRFLTKFINDTTAAGTLPNQISWHELSNEDGTQIQNHVNIVRGLVGSNIPISINETVPPTIHIRPANILSYLSALEMAKVTSAGRSCWSDPYFINPPDPYIHNNGLDNSLDGILTPMDVPPRQPRASFWIYKSYADMTGSIALADPKQSGSNITMLASKDSVKKIAKLLIGNLDKTLVQDVALQLQNLSGVNPTWIDSAQVRVVIERIRNSEFYGLPKTEKIFQATLRMGSGKLEFVVPDLGPGEVALVTLGATR